jgi:hypothetical protein
MRVLLEALNSKDEQVRLKAAQVIAERGFGKAHQSIDQTLNAGTGGISISWLEPQPAQAPKLPSDSA